MTISHKHAVMLQSLTRPATASLSTFIPIASCTASVAICEKRLISDKRLDMVYDLDLP